MSKNLTTRSEDYSKWYNELVVKADLAENSAVRKNKRVRISQRTTFAHWLIKIGRSRYDCIQPL